jgi:hypothetical protein
MLDNFYLLDKKFIEITIDRIKYFSSSKIYCSNFNIVGYSNIKIKYCQSIIRTSLVSPKFDIVLP